MTRPSGSIPSSLRSPQFVHDGLSERLGVPVVVKVETVNPIRSFKGRGTWLAVHGLAGEGRIGPDRPIVVASAGNFGQGVAYAARALGVSAVVFTSRHANRGKVARMRALGATVIAEGEDFDDARGAVGAIRRRARGGAPCRRRRSADRDGGGESGTRADRCGRRGRASAARGRVGARSAMAR